MRDLRTLPEIARNITTTVEQLATLVSRAESGTITTDELAVLARLETERHMFASMCRRHTPLNLIACGFDWGDVIRHEADPKIEAKVRVADLVTIDGTTMTISEATRRLAPSTGGGPAIAAWTGTKGRLGTMASLEHPAKPIQVPIGATNYDLFG